MIHTTLLIISFAGLLAVSNQTASEVPSGVAPGRVAVSNRAGQNNDVQVEVAPRTAPPRNQIAQTSPAPRAGSSTASQGLGTVYVVPQSAVIRDGLGGKAIANVSQGTALTVLANDRLQVQVRTPSGQVGYIPKRQVQSAPPAAPNRNIGGLIREDRSATELRTAASMRGLSEEAKDLARSEGITEEAIRSVEEFEKFALSITDSDVDQFRTQGGLNP
jgi:hypothetical protein